MFDDKTAQVFIDNQLKLYPEEVVSGLEEAKEFLEESMAVVADNAQEVMDYLDETGVDTEEMTEEQILEMPEVFDIGDGRYLILEI